MVAGRGEMLLVVLAFERFSAMAEEKDLPPIKRGHFTELMKPLMREKYGSLRNDLVVDGRYQRGWKDVRLVGK